MKNTKITDMKKIFLGCMLAAGLASCSNDEPAMERQDASDITFGVTATTVSRAGSDGVYCNNNKPTEFKVYGEYTGNGQTAVQYMDDDIVSTDGGATYTNTTADRYWPQDGTLDFYAYNDASFNTATKSYENFQVAGTVGAQTDLLYAVQKGQSKAATGTQPKVDLNFRHALSQIVFKAVNENPNLKVTITGVGVNNLYDTNTYSLAGITDNTQDNIEDHTGAGTQTTDRGAWNAFDASAAHTAAYSVTFDEQEVGSTAINLTEGNDAVVDGSFDKASFSNAMLLLPQEQSALNLKEQQDTPGTASNGGSYFTVTCTITNLSGDAEVQLYSGDIRIPADIKWQEGYKYVYTFKFGKGNGGWDPHDPKPVLVPIEFTVTVDDFVDYTPATDLDLDMKTE